MKNFLLFTSILIMLALVGPQRSFAQVQGLSYTLSPYGEYLVASKSSGLENGWFAGAQLGFGFGEFVELGANYSKSISLRTDIDNFELNLTESQRALYRKMDVDITRYGGEIKLNLSRGSLLPYVTLGTGVQEMSLDTFQAHKQIYLDAGLGIKFTAADRYTIGLQAINSNYKMNPYRTLLTQADRENVGIDLTQTESGTISNWSARASIMFYIGGRKPGVLSDIDQAYLDNFSGGFSGLNIPFEFAVSKMDFHKDLPYKDTWMAGGSAGLNFGPLVGVRGFYWRAIEDGKTTSFDDLYMLGGEARFKLNEGKGFTPWLTVGGGSFHVGEEYLQVVDSINTGNKGFAMGGLGVDLPFSKYVNATGFARAVLMSTDGISSRDVTAPDELKTSWNYGVSLNFVLGRSKKKIAVVEQTTFDEYILASTEEQAAATAQLKAQYEARIKVLEADLNQAVADQDAEAVKAIADEKSKAEKVVSELNKDSQPVKETIPSATEVAPAAPAPAPENLNSPSVIKMTPSEFQLLLGQLLEASRAQSAAPQPTVIQPTTTQPTSSVDLRRELEASIKMQNDMEQLKNSLAELKSLQTPLSQSEKTTNTSNTAVESDLMARINKLEKELSKAISIMESNQDPKSSAVTKDDVQRAIDQAVEKERMSNDMKNLKKQLQSMEKEIADLKAAEKMEQKMNAGTPGASMNQNDNRNNVPISEISNKDRVTTYNDDQQAKTGVLSNIRYKGMSGFAGFGLGDNATFNLGYRVHYQVGSDSSKLELMPETFFGFGSPSAFGLTVNGVYDLSGLTKSKYINPYIGAGLGFMKVGENGNEDKLVGAINFLVGTSLNVMNGDLYVDFTARNLFKYNQLIVGYRFPF